VSSVVLTFLLETGSAAAFAESYHRGIVEYEVACMPCHGIDGRGGPTGQDAQDTSTRPNPDYTLKSWGISIKKNCGEFPSKRIAETIDGHAIVAAHGKGDMPV